MIDKFLNSRMQWRIFAHAMLENLVEEPDESEKFVLLSKVLQWAIRPASFTWAMNLLGLMPRDWLVANLGRAVEPLLADDDSQTHSILFAICKEVDLSLALEIAGKSSRHPDVDVAETGEYFVENFSNLSKKFIYISVYCKDSANMYVGEDLRKLLCESILGGDPSGFRALIAGIDPIEFEPEKERFYGVIAQGPHGFYPIVVNRRGERLTSTGILPEGTRIEMLNVDL